MNSWQIGNIKITRVVEMQVAGGTRFILPQATPETILPMRWLQPHFANDKGQLIMSIHALVIETPDRKMIVDTCIGNDKKRSIANWSNLQLPFLEDLQKAGYDRFDIDTVMCTHLHVDHVGWNTMLVDGEWIPTFPNAEYLMGKKEYEYWHNTEPDQLNDGLLEDSVKPVFDAGLVKLVPMDFEVCEGIYLEATPGHTPGHVSIHIESQDQHALITGDSIHHPCQIEKVQWSSSADYDQVASKQTRESLLAKYGDSNVLIIGTHFATPTAGYLRKEGSTYVLDVVSTDPVI
ncbi:MAG TPA: MBL fold metallo-hydrolase [Gammaproteobacteria bacterium]|jgi:glyoxylase-like metal-dependent hydrolase (beta-lactamase superfamily II)|nr:MBL fold metallo-hydrolase [Gammaproteobacteria bacterium]HIK69205.1 MBL fold metallo-hydrolase [Pseudomonadales bacterium]